MNSISRRSIFIQVLCISAFLAVPIIFSGPNPREHDQEFSKFLMQKRLFSNLILILFFYFNYYFLLPYYYFTKKNLQFSIGILISLLIVLFLPEIFQPNHHFEGPRRGPGGFPFMRFEDSFIFYLVLFFVSLSLKINERWKKTEEEKLNAELSYLKAQINPHFLFNTLNSIYSLAIKKSDDTANAVVKLSGMMRYLITDAQIDFIDLKKELNYINSYIELQKIRLGNTATIVLNLDSSDEDLKIAPLILITFVENAFKHGVNPEEISIISIDIKIENNKLHLHVYNKKVNKPNQSENETGLGIENAKQRLNLIYPSDYKLKVVDNNNEFIIDLTIKLK